MSAPDTDTKPRRMMLEISVRSNDPDRRLTPSEIERAIQDVLIEAAGRLGASVEVGEAWDARGNLEGF